METLCPAGHIDGGKVKREKRRQNTEYTVHSYVTTTDSM